MPMPPKFLTFLLLLCAFSLRPSASSAAPQQNNRQEPQRKDTPDGDYAAELPRIPPTEPAEAAKKFTLAPGFRIELVASEPQLASPVAMAFDEAARIYVVEMRDYSEQDKEHLGRIRLLEDKGADGHYETASIYAENLSWPTAILCYDGGVFVGAAPDILYLKDANGDGRIDEKNEAERRVIFTGFGRTNVQGLMNSFQWGPDNRVYVAVSSSGAQLKTPAYPDRPIIDLRGRDLAFDPKTLKAESIAGGAQHGMTFTKWGERLVCSNSDHLQWIAYDDSHAAKNPFLTAPPARVSIAADGPQAEVFRTSPVEPWRVVRTRLRATGVVPGLVEGGGRASGYFTSATGVTAVTGTAFPPVPGDPDGEWVVVGDVGSNLVHRKKLFIENGMLRGARVDEKSELLTSSDNWFRPVQFANGPDGALYILDMYREVIEHPASLPPAIKKHLDLTSGRDRGRIWRLVKDDFKRQPPRDLSKLPTPDLITCLSDPNGWTRTTASRLLYERQKYEQDRNEIIAALRTAALSETQPPIAMFHLLNILAATYAETEAADDLLGKLPVKAVAKCLESATANLRLAASRICEKRMHLLLVPQLIKLLEDENPLIRRSAAFALGQADANLIMTPMVQLAKRDDADALTRYAVQAGFEREPAIFLNELLRDEDFRDRLAAHDWFDSLTSAAKRLLEAPIVTKSFPSKIPNSVEIRETGPVTEADQRANIEAIAGAIAMLLPKDRLLAGDIMFAMSTPRNAKLGERIRETTGGESERLIQSYLSNHRARARDKSQPIENRVRHIRRLEPSSFSSEKAWLDEAFSLQEPAEPQLAALDLISKFNDDAIGEWLITKWDRFTPKVRDRAISVLVSRSSWLAAVFKAIDEKIILVVDVPPAIRTSFAQHPTEAIRKRAMALFGQSTKKDREAIFTAYRPALSANGDPAKGKPLFAKHCSACHQVEGVGNATGPNLATMKARGAEAILTNVIDPNREVLPQYLSYVVELTDGRILSGMIESESPTTLVLRKADGQKESVQRVGIDSLRSTGQSLMPEGLEKQLDQAAMADLLAYLMKAE